MLLYKRLFNYVKNKIPKISETEMIALQSGGTSIDRSILRGKVKIFQKNSYGQKLAPDLDMKIKKLFEKYDSNTQVFPNNNNNECIKYLANKKFFSFLINKEYGGIKLTVNQLSNVLTKISSVNPAIGVATMVPNSLGPGELLINYGTEKQKNKYLPRLASGELVPCFGLTGPNNGSDASGKIDKGHTFKEGDDIKIRITLNKRYITLAPVASLMGIAFTLHDHNDLVNKSGVTLALVERNHPGLIVNTMHNPLNAGFPNGTIKGTIDISLDQIIGGEEQIGNGWKMLMECLSAGRGVSLPATALASSKVSSYGIINYIKVREQFNLQLSNMQAIQEKINKIIFNTWLIQSSVGMTNDILDSGVSPSVISAIMKQQCTERGRIVINEAMDVHGGAAICIGYNNFLEKFYKSIPIGITVEGSNTLTRSLIIFAQGLNKSHPYIYPLVNSVLTDNFEDFKTHFNNMIKHVFTLYFSSFSINTNLEQQIIDFACLTNFVSLKGGSIKREQMLSGDMADIFGNLYMAVSVKWYHKNYPTSDILTEYAIQKLLHENQLKINKIVNNLSYERFVLQHLKKNVKEISYKHEEKVYKEIINNSKIMESIEENIVKEGVLDDLDKINKLYKDDPEYKKLYDKIINVGEYPIINENKIDIHKKLKNNIVVYT